MPPKEEAPTLLPAMEAFIDMAVMSDQCISLETMVKKIELSSGNVVDVMFADSEYQDWLADNNLPPQPASKTASELSVAVKSTLGSLFSSPSMEGDLVQEVKRSYHAVMTSLKTFGKDLNDIKSGITAKSEQIENHPILIDSVEVYRFLTKDGKQVDKLITCLDEDDKFIAACEKHFKRLFEKSNDFGKRFRAAATSKSVETIRSAIDELDEALLDRNSLADLTKFNLLGNRVVELDKRGYPSIKSLKGDQIKFASGEKDENNLVSQIAHGKLKGFSIGGDPKSIKGIQGFNMIEGKKHFNAELKKSSGSVGIADFVKVMARAQTLNQDSIRFAQMAATMAERVARLSDDLNDAFDDVSTDGEKYDKVLHRELIDLHKAARRSVSQYMFLGKIVATMMEDHASFIYRGVTNMANQVLKNAKEVKPSPFDKKK